MNPLALNDRYLNKEITLLTNSVIIEYDMKDAGMSLIQKYKLLPDKKIKKLLKTMLIETPTDKKWGKHKSNVEIGILQQTNIKLTDGLKQGFINARDDFLTKNKLEPSDVLSIKKDALFIMKMVKHTELDEYITFRPKSMYTGYILINKLEVYYNNAMVDIKGLGVDDTDIHKPFMISFLIKFFRKTENSDKEETLKFLRLFVDKYKQLKLPFEYYIEFRPKGKLRYKDGVQTEFDYRQDPFEYDISYNYNILISIIKNVI